MKKVISILVVIAAIIGMASCFTLNPDPNELALGVKAPPAKFQKSDSTPVTVQSLFAKGHPVLVFYRGQW